MEERSRGGEGEVLRRSGVARESVEEDLSREDFERLF